MLKTFHLAYFPDPNVHLLKSYNIKAESMVKAVVKHDKDFPDHPAHYCYAVPEEPTLHPRGFNLTPVQ